MNFKLKVRNGPFPPRGYPYTDPRTGMKFEHGDFKDVVGQIIKHRQANPRFYPKSEPIYFDFGSVSNELDDATCSRLNNNPKWCESGDPIPISTDGLELMLMPNKCQRCGCSQGYQYLCPTCSGRRVLYYICRDCNTIVPK